MKELSVDLLQYGDLRVKGVRLHEKVAACTILAQVITGSYEVVRGDEKIVVEPGCCFLAHEGDSLAIMHNGKPEMSARFLHFKFSYQNIIKVDQFYRFPLLLNLRQSKPFNKILDYFETSSQEKDSLVKVTADYKMSFLLLENLLLIGSEVSSFELMHYKIEKFLPLYKWLHQNIRMKIEVEDMANFVNLSSSRLYKVFKDSFGVSPMNYLKRIRLAEAQVLVITTDKSMEEISEMVGFNNPFHFSREFKLEYSMAPLMYRKQSVGI